MKQYVKELYRRKDLIHYLVTSNLKAQHRNSALGYLWWMLDPLLSVFVYYFLVVIVMDRGGKGYGPFLVVGLVVFKSFSATITNASKSIIRQAGIITQVYLPKVVFPIASSISQLINFLFGVLVIILFLLVNKIQLGQALLWFPYILLIHLSTLIAISLFVAYICVFLRDIENFLTYINMLLRYGSPVIWEITSLPEKFMIIARINPLSAFLNSYRNIFLYNIAPEVMNLLIIGIVSIAVSILFVFVYSRTEHKIVMIL
jgi:ABC-type polysaccharide/polyol phosphate export permease